MIVIAHRSRVGPERQLDNEASIICGLTNANSDGTTAFCFTFRRTMPTVLILSIAQSTGPILVHTLRPIWTSKLQLPLSILSQNTVSAFPHNTRGFLNSNWSPSCVTTLGPHPSIQIN